jgi:hypothetical protein
MLVNALLPMVDLDTVYERTAYSNLKRHKALEFASVFGTFGSKKTNASCCISDAKFRQSELKNGKSLQTRRTPARIGRMRLIIKIRHMVGSGRHYREIMDTLEIPERS